jgi:hypothetical protein
MSKKFKTPLKKVRAAAARIPQVSANAFKAIPTAQNKSHQRQSEEQVTEYELEAENLKDQRTAGSDVSASKSRKRSHSELRSPSPVASIRSSSPVALLQNKKKFRKRSHSELRSPSPVASIRSSSPVALLQNKKKFRKRSHSESRRSSSPVANSLRSSSPVARSSSPVVPLKKKAKIGLQSANSLRSSSRGSSPVARSSSPVVPLKKKAKTGPQSAPSARKDQPTTSIPVYREGAEIKHKKPKASDYEDIVQALILRAASQYEASVSTQDSFPDTAQRLKWARKSWRDANNDVGHDYEITDEISSLVSLLNLIY